MKKLCFLFTLNALANEIYGIDQKDAIYFGYTQEEMSQDLLKSVIQVNQ